MSSAPPASTIPTTTIPTTTTAPDFARGSVPPLPPGFPTTTLPRDSQGAVIPPCAATMFEARLALDKASYRPGEHIYGTSTYTNVSGRACAHSGANSHVDVFDSRGERLNAPIYSHIGFTETVVVAAGQVVTRPSPLWDQRNCVSSTLGADPCRQAAPGEYRVVDVYDPFGSAAATVRLVAG